MTSDILEKYAPCDEDLEWLHTVVGPLCLSTRATTASSYALGKYVLDRDIPGDIAECGVFAGGQIAAIYRGMVSSGHVPRAIHLFDSFQGIPHAGPEDTDNIDGTLFSHGRDGALVTSGISSCTADAVRYHMGRCGVPVELMTFWHGWFQYTVPDAIDKINALALLRLDGDLYESTSACWPLIDKVSPGGIVIVDDYALAGCRKSISEYLKSRNLAPKIDKIPEGLGPVFWIQTT